MISMSMKTKKMKTTMSLESTEDRIEKLEKDLHHTQWLTAILAIELAIFVLASCL